MLKKVKDILYRSLENKDISYKNAKHNAEKYKCDIIGCKEQTRI